MHYVTREHNPSATHLLLRVLVMVADARCRGAIDVRAAGPNDAQRAAADRADGAAARWACRPCWGCASRTAGSKHAA